MKRYLPFILLFILGGGTVVYFKARGLRNNNPGNIKKTSDQWQGLKAVQADDVFFQFIDMKWGVRALLKILTNYFYRYNLSTIEKIINRWAPPAENDTGAYVNFVAAQLGILKNQPIVIEDSRVEIAKAITKYENGFNPISDSTFYEAEALL